MLRIFCTGICLMSSLYVSAQDSIPSLTGNASMPANGKNSEIKIFKSDEKCNEQGIVVVAVAVNPKGEVIEVTAPARGSTTTAICLVEQAKAAALKTRFNPSADAPEKQYGTIKYDFKLKE